MTISGGCLCRAVRYTVAADALATRLCWCRDCQYFAAGSGTVNVVFPASSVTLTGPLRDYCSVADSGNRMHRRFCPQCGIHIFSAAEARPGGSAWTSRRRIECVACILEQGVVEKRWSRRIEF